MHNSTTPLLGVLLLSCLCLSWGQTENVCQNIVANDGTRYDLSQLLTEQSEVTISQKGGVLDYFYFVELCGESTRGCVGCSRVGFCETWQGGVHTSCVGSFSSAAGLDDGAGVELIYEGGFGNRQGIVKISCDPSGGIADNVQLQNNGAQFTMSFKSSAACVAYDNTFAVLFFVVFIVVVVIYMVGGIVWNKFKLEKEGADIFPHKDFWFMLPTLVIEGVKFIFSGFKKEEQRH
eukprot:TRINITY_DN5630_c1_g1_i1.p1 TRINITY_DN5630_c1_g1~~TRINITY_DN5630_c1_g1_i1.p1  ORF type:complete len:234 (-),score=48.36 TRINITY_DN5630_c1_g1_i1:59-760(-)